MKEGLIRGALWGVVVALSLAFFAGDHLAPSFLAKPSLLAGTGATVGALIGFVLSLWVRGRIADIAIVLRPVPAIWKLIRFETIASAAYLGSYEYCLWRASYSWDWGPLTASFFFGLPSSILVFLKPQGISDVAAFAVAAGMNALLVFLACRWMRKFTS